MRYVGEEKRPEVFDAGNCAKAVALHLALFAAIWKFGAADSDAKETIIPIDLSVVVEENLDGEPDEPPPERPRQPEPESPPPQPAPPPPEPPPPPPEQTVPDAVIPEPPKEEPKKQEKPKEPEKPKEQEKSKEPEKPKMTREERLAKMRESAKPVKDAPRRPDPPPRNNGRTEMRPKDWEKLLMAGYKPAATNSGLDASEAQRCLAYLRRAFYERWDIPAWTDRLGEMHLEVRLGAGGKIEGYRLVRSSGDAAADRSVLVAASRVERVRGLSQAFIENNRTVIVKFTVKPE